MNAQDVQAGKKAVGYFASVQGRSADQVASMVIPKNPEILYDGLGGAIREIGMRDSQVKQAMENLARISNGQIPNMTSFFNALHNRMTNITFVDIVYATPEIAMDTAKDAVKAAQSFGDTLLKYGPFILIGVGALYAINILNLMPRSK